MTTGPGRSLGALSLHQRWREAQAQRSRSVMPAPPASGEGGTHPGGHFGGEPRRRYSFGTAIAQCLRNVRGRSADYLAVLTEEKRRDGRLHREGLRFESVTAHQQVNLLALPWDFLPQDDLNKTGPLTEKIVRERCGRCEESLLHTVHKHRDKIRWNYDSNSRLRADTVAVLAR